VSLGGYGLSLRTEDIAKFGQVYLQRGMWNGQQLVPAAWVDSATSRWMSNGSNPASDWDQGYGFQFWRCRNGAFRGDGAHGQFCVVRPEQDAVVAITAGTRDLHGVLNVVWAKILPALQAGALSADGVAEAKLRRKLASLALKRSPAVEKPALAVEIGGKRFVFPRNPQLFEAITLTPSDEDVAGTQMTVVIDGAENRVKVAGSSWTRGELANGPSAGKIAASGAWTVADTFTFDVVRHQTPFAAKYRMKFSGDELKLETIPNVGPTPPVIVGRRE